MNRPIVFRVKSREDGEWCHKPDPFADCEYDDHTTPEKYDRLLRSVLQRFCMGAADAKGEDDDTV